MPKSNDMNFIEKAITVLEKQRDGIDKKIATLQSARKIIKENHKIDDSASVEQKIMSVLSENDSGLAASEISKKINAHLPTVRTTLSRLKTNNSIAYDDINKLYKSIG